MIRLSRLFASGARRTRKSNDNVVVHREEDGVITVETQGKYLIVDTLGMDKWEAIGAIKWAILNEGLVYTRKVEKEVQKVVI